MTRITIGRIVTALLVATGAPVSSAAQSTVGQSQPTFGTGVDVVRLDVSVLDKNRRPVRNLTAADFTVLEEGVHSFQAASV